ncbi:RNA polymerase sigma factor [Dermatobacter hominis]|uniref:RNA polymerase sigma factor n=1 Tax=Dermatobacter hominis TaxID=2884263 RepID=UPI001D0F8E21|nr:sigma-70 family RNA polymerase sigma factor [Dermatobacter hominis]UDY37626.1 sigma-70 family RNA polymerase sigma factor [Dermatobacter hominis]
MEVSIERIVRAERGRVVATLRRLTGDLDRAEDAVSDAVVDAFEQWPRRGIPERPGAWLTTVARRRALDRIRRESQRGDRERAAHLAAALESEPDPLPWSTIRDDQLRLVFTCCHPALGPDARVALALRTVCGLTTVEIARAFLVPEATVGQRISRAKAKIAANRIPYRVPTDAELPDRLPAVLAVVDVVLATGHHAPLGDDLQRPDLIETATWLARLLVELLPDEPECVGLLSLCLSVSARSATRVDPDGHAVLLADADRSQWDHDATAEAVSLLDRALRRGRPGPFQVRAAISCLHSVATVDSTDWPQIVELYRILEDLTPTVPVRVNRAVAEAEVGGPDAGLALLEHLADSAEAQRWHLYHAARAEMLRRTGDRAGSAEALRAALALGPNDADRRLLQERLRSVEPT